MSEYIYQSATQLASLIREGLATSTEIVKAHLDQIKKINGKLNALVSIFEEEALQTASELDREAGDGKFRGLLHGVPVTIKEQFWIRGKNSNTNFKMLKDFVAPEDAVVVDRIRRAGAVILGQTNVPRNLIDYQVSGDLYPEGKNPYNTDYSPGGSTGGGAAAVAAGMSPLELGGDMGGSIRVPCSFCGLYGLKPTEKTVPLHGNIPLPENTKTFIIHFAQAGPLARNIEDIELLWTIIKGPHASDRNIPDIKWKPPVKNALNQFKVAWTDSWPGFEPSNLVRQAIESLAEKLKENGCPTQKTIPDETLHQDSLKIFMGMFPYIIAQGTSWLVRQLIQAQLHKNLMAGLKKEAPWLVREMSRAFRMSTNHYGEVLLQRSLVTQRWETFFEKYDFLICPVAFGPAFRRCKTGSRLSYEGKEMIYLKYAWPYVTPFNASGNPTLSIPIGLSPEGLPIGLQIVGKYWSEPELFQFAKLIAPLTKGFIKPGDMSR